MPGKVHGEQDVNQAMKDVPGPAGQRELPGQRPKAEAPGKSENSRRPVRLQWGDQGDRRGRQTGT